MEYTKWIHKPRLARVQKLLEAFFEVGDALNLVPDENIVLRSEPEDGWLFELANLQVLGENFFILAWRTPDQPGQLLKMQYDLESLRVVDTTTFSARGFRLGGQIHCWHNFDRNEEIDAVEWIKDVLREITRSEQWERRDFIDNELILSLNS